MKSAENRATLNIRRWWPVPILIGVLFAAALLLASASTAAPQAIEFSRQPLSTDDGFGAYPDIATGDNGLVAVVWTEGDDPLIDKQNGPLKLAWTSNSVSQWTTISVDAQTVYGAAVATDGDTIHVVWSRNKTTLKHTTCTPGPDAQYSCASASTVTTVFGEDTALQVDIVVDNNQIPHVVWVEEQDEGDPPQTQKTKRIYYSRKETGAWTTKATTFIGLQCGDYADSEGPALAYANNLIHLLWVEWNTEPTDSVIQYARRGAGEEQGWTLCKTLGDWDSDDYRARNPSITAYGSNVFAAWDFLSIDDKHPISKEWQERSYVVGYRHSTDNGSTWRQAHSYPDGADTGSSLSGASIFKSSEGTTGVEWVHYVRPGISLAASGTVTVPVLTWHAQVSTGGGGEEGLASINQETAYKVFWDYATGPGSDVNGIIAWAGTPITLSTGLCGGVDMSIDAASGRLAPVGDLGDILAGDTSNSHLHVTYHEQTDSTSDLWRVLYNNHNNQHTACHFTYLPVIAKNAIAGGGEE